MKRRLFSILMTAAMVLSLLPVVGMAAEAEAPEADVFFDDFNENTLDSSRWLIAHKRWGGDNGGVVKENVSVSDGKLMLEGHGLNYTGDVPGIGREDGKLTGAAIATRDYYASGSYEVVAKIAPELGACSALWTFEYEEYYPGQEGYIPELATWGYCTVNHEIDIEIPTGTSRNPDPNFSSARFNTYLRENDYTPHYHDLGQNLNDGEFHTYRFDWHTGDTNQTARVEFYIDDVLQYTSYTDIPTNEGRFWIGLWFPYSIDSNHDGEEDTGWSGLADFDITFFEIDSVKITPFHEAGDTAQHETYAYDGWAPNSFPELAEQEAYEHIVNGDFAQGSSAWTLEDEAYVAGEKLHLSSGQVRDEAYQLVDVLPAATYTITADVVTDGTEVRIGACKENGGNDQYATVTESGKVSFTFQNDTVNPVLKVYAKVDRWQGSDVQVTVDNISMVGAEYVAQPVTVFVPSE
ncbi:MAG: glycoside hydrolase family 16 protein, partial [Ruminiclostridium sp.]|nr:glycoside hydrolase family 16 protein [Ruminiclostridium sp.]